MEGTDRLRGIGYQRREIDGVRRSRIVRRRHDAGQCGKMRARPRAADGGHQRSFHRGARGCGNAVGVGQIDLVVVRAQQRYIGEFQQRLQRTAIPLQAGFGGRYGDIRVRYQVSAGRVTRSNRRDRSRRQNCRGAHTDDRNCRNRRAGLNAHRRIRTARNNRHSDAGQQRHGRRNRLRRQREADARSGDTSDGKQRDAPRIRLRSTAADGCVACTQQAGQMSKPRDDGRRSAALKKRVEPVVQRARATQLREGKLRNAIGTKAEQRQEMIDQRRSFAGRARKTAQLLVQQPEDELHRLGAQVAGVEYDILRARAVELELLQRDLQIRRSAARRQWGKYRIDDDRIQTQGIAAELPPQMQAQAELQRAIGGSRDRRDGRAVEADDRQMGAQTGQRRRRVVALEQAGESEGRRPIVLDREVRVTARLIAEQRMPRLAGGHVRHLRRGQESVEQTEKRGALAAVAEQRLDTGKRILKPRSLQVAAVVEQADRLAHIEYFAGEIVAADHAVPFRAMAAPAERLNLPAVATMPRGERLRSSA